MLPVIDQSDVKPTRTAVSLLRDCTAETHERLHSHAVFSPLMSGQIERAEYIDLLLALHGFHAGFEDLVADGPVRCRRLIGDLEFLGADAERIDRAPRLATPVVPHSAARWGIEYVLGGATLGGRVLARKLDPMLGRGELNGRRFFTNDGESTGKQWQTFIEQLELALPTPIERNAAAAAALATFAQFEFWMTHIVAVRPSRAGVFDG